jgi:putative membrane protein
MATKLKRLDQRSEPDIINILTHLIITVISLMIVDYLLPGLQIIDLRAAVISAIVIGVINTFIRPLAQFIAFPLTILTLGIAAFFVNVAMLYLAAYVVPGFTIDSFITALIASIVLSLVTAFLNKIARE